MMSDCDGEDLCNDVRRLSLDYQRRGYSPRQVCQEIAELALIGLALDGDLSAEYLHDIVDDVLRSAREA